MADEVLPVEGGPSVDWAPALELLARKLGENGWQNANLRVVVADGWTRMALVPWSSELRTIDEVSTHARMVLAQRYGEMDSDWRLALGDATPRMARLACAMPTALVDRIEALAADARLRLLSLQPQLVVAFNVWRGQLPRAGGWFVSLDTGSLAAAYIRRGGWDQVRTARVGSDWLAELNRLRRFGRLASGESEKARVFVDAPLWVRKLAGQHQDDFELLEGADERPLNTLQWLIARKGMHA
jgi:hypothetical protein